MKRKPRPERTLKLTVEYDGSAFFGWQIQKNRRTVQGELARAIREITGEKKVTVHGAGRTDTGVHAQGQVAHFRTCCRVPVEKWPKAINGHLDEDVSVVMAEEVDPEFHAQYSAGGKLYRYVILNRDVRSPLYRGATHLVRAPLDVAAMQQGATLLVGTHDFRSFGSNVAKKTGTTRTVRRLSVEAKPPFVVMEVEGDGFLYNMVRSITGTLLEVGLGKQPAEWVGDVLAAKDRRKAGQNVPAKGLTLVRVFYE